MILKTRAVWALALAGALAGSGCGGKSADNGATTAASGGTTAPAPAKAPTKIDLSTPSTGTTTGTATTTTTTGTTGTAAGGAFSSPNGYTLSPPAGWKSNPGMMGGDVVFMAPDGTGSNINMVVTSAGPSDTLDNAKTQIPAMMAKMISGYAQKDQGDTKLGGEPAFFNTFAGQVMGRQMQMRQTLAVRNGKAYTLTCTAPEDKFDQEKAAFDSSISTLQWK